MKRIEGTFLGGSLDGQQMTITVGDDDEAFVLQEIDATVVDLDGDGVPDPDAEIAMRDVVFRIEVNPAPDGTLYVFEREKS